MLEQLIYHQLAPALQVDLCLDHDVSVSHTGKTEVYLVGWWQASLMIAFMMHVTVVLCALFENQMYSARLYGCCTCTLGFVGDAFLIYSS